MESSDLQNVKIKYEINFRNYNDSNISIMLVVILVIVLYFIVEFHGSKEIYGMFNFIVETLQTHQNTRENRFFLIHRLFILTIDTTICRNNR